MFASFVKKLTSSNISPSAWEPSDPIPSGSTASHSPFKLPISSLSTVSLRTEGAWSHGTVLFETRENAHPPTYDAAVTVLAVSDAKRVGPQLGDGQGFLEASVHARYNDEDLYRDAKVEFHTHGDDVELSITTPSMSPGRVASQLSFHVTFFFPPQLPIVKALRTTGSQWRTLGAPSLSSTFFHSVSISTSNTPISFHMLNAGRVSLETANGKVNGQYECESMRVKTVNAPIEGRYTVQGACELHTTNGGTNAEAATGSLSIHDGNARVKGTYRAKDGIIVHTSNGAVEGTYVSPGGVTVETSNDRISGTYSAGDHLALKTHNATIEGTVTLLAPSASDEPARATTPPLLDTPPTLPTYESGGKVRVKVTTSNSAIKVDFVRRAKGLELIGEFTTSNAVINVSHEAPFVGKFDLSTSNATTAVEAPPDHEIHYATQSRTHTTGSISTKGLEESSAMRLKTSNAAVRLVV